MGLNPRKRSIVKILISGLLLSFLWTLIIVSPIVAQTPIPNLSKENRKLRINGGLRLMNDMYAHSGIDPRRDAFQFRAQARLNFNFLGINAPFTFNFSDGNQNFRLPSYTFAGISPKYKIATAHLGDRSLFFSKYTLGNITFRGAGLELRPGKLYFAGMYGRLKRAVAEDLDSRQNLDPSYKRMGYAFKAGYQGEDSKVNFTFFSAKDDEHSIEDPIERAISPQANIVMSLQAYEKITKSINIQGEWARSLFNRDTRAVGLLGQQSFERTLFGLFTPNASYQQGDAYNVKLNYSGQDVGLNLGYERITRGFRTLGAIFFNNDLENITAGMNKAWVNGKLILALNGGIERTNLDEFESEKTNRIIGSANLTYTPALQWTYNAQYSNFQNSTKLRANNNLELFIDSIFLAQVTQTASLSATHLMGEKGDEGSLSALLSYQHANSIIEDEISEDQNSDFWYAAVIYRAAQKEHFGWGTSLSMNRSSFDNIASTYITPSFLADYSLLDGKLKMDSNLSFNYITQADNQTMLLNLGLGTNYAPHPSHHFRLSANIIQQFGSGEAIKGFFESYINLSYGYKFKSGQASKKRL